MYKKIKVKLSSLLSSRMKFKEIGENVSIEKNNQFFQKENIEIGNNVYIGFEGLFFGYGGIKIGEGSIIAHRVEIMTRNHNYDSEDLRAIPYDSRYILKPVIIESNVWIGSNVKITPGVTVGEGAIIAMGSVITKNVPRFAVVGGNPAKVIKYRNEDRYIELKEKDLIYLKLKKLHHNTI